MDTSTMQSMVDKSHEEFIVKSRRKGVDRSGACVYFFEDGTPACVLGLFLPPNMAVLLKEKFVNDSSINGLLAMDGMQDILRQDSATTIDELFDDVGMRFLTGLQRAHDGATRSGGAFRSAFDNRLRALSADFKLNYPLTLAA